MRTSAPQIESIAQAEARVLRMSKQQAKRTADEVFKAFRELAEESGSVIAHFEQAFNERGQITELCEAEGGANGLTGVLAGLLRRTPPDSYLNAECSSGVYRNDSFMKDFHTALNTVADRYPNTLVLMQEHASQGKFLLKDILRALLLRYTNHKAVYPY